ncbi:uncharacterized protein LOC121385196 [Gigantopelta aegis]|uniref:uncharacterized protein LOC121385196 n=1 Tax=Gigantopelta aegis TaxID=1735272 RepID=UPI001B88AFB1|nr:uncharacterized protein LOC121385196 [Gigantopelta aegis]
MGNIGGSRLKDKDRDKTCFQFYDRLLLATPGQLMYSCSYTKWVRSKRSVCGFTDKVDYTSTRETYRRTGILVKPDTLEGRFFSVTMKSHSEMVISEKLSSWVELFKIPKVPVPDVDDPHWLQQVHHNRTRKECNVVGYRGGIAVVQVNCDRHYSIAKFYILDLTNCACLGHFLIMYHTRRWYECYISPNKLRICLRPDHLTRIMVLPDNYIIQNLHIYPSENFNISVEIVPPMLRTYAITFNQKLGDDFAIVASNTDIEVRNVSDWLVVRQVSNLNLSANIQQVRSSPLGDFLAVRCIHPIHSREFSTNCIAVLSFPKLEIVMKVDVRGCYWPVSEVVNLQVFPRFAPSETCIAVMKNSSYKRKVFVYKLPSVMQSLQSFCRRTLLQLVKMDEFVKLPLPNKLQDYLQFREKIAHRCEVRNTHDMVTRL